MQTVGASKIWADLALTSSARCWPTSYKRSWFHVAASDTPHGNKAAYTSLSKFASIFWAFLWWNSPLCRRQRYLRGHHLVHHSSLLPVSLSR